MNNLPSIEDVIPHRGPMLLLDRIVSDGGNSIDCEVVLRPQSSFVVETRVAAVVALEYMAQASATWLGLMALRNSRPPTGGYLLGTRQLDLNVDYFSVGERLLVRAEHVWGDEGFQSFACNVTRDDRIVAAATLNVLRSQKYDQP